MNFRSLVYISLRDQSVASLGPELKSVLNTCSFTADSQTVFYDVASFEGTPEHIVLQWLCLPASGSQTRARSCSSVLLSLTPSPLTTIPAKFLQLQESRTSRERESLLLLSVNSFKWELFKALICQSAAELRTRHYRISHSQLITEPESELTGRCRLGLGAWDKLSMTNPRTHNVQHCIETTHIIRNNCP